MVRLWYTLPGHRLVLPDRPRGAGLPGEAGGRRNGALHAAGLFVCKDSSLAFIASYAVLQFCYSSCL